jgi:hypothetical protein
VAGIHVLAGKNYYDQKIKKINEINIDKYIVQKL